MPAYEVDITSLRRSGKTTPYSQRKEEKMKDRWKRGKGRKDEPATINIANNMDLYICKNVFLYNINHMRLTLTKPRSIYVRPSSRDAFSFSRSAMSFVNTSEFASARSVTWLTISDIVDAVVGFRRGDFVAPSSVHFLLFLHRRLHFRHRVVVIS